MIHSVCQQAKNSISPSFVNEDLESLQYDFSCDLLINK